MKHTNTKTHRLSIGIRSQFSMSLTVEKDNSDGWTENQYQVIQKKWKIHRKRALKRFFF